MEDHQVCEMKTQECNTTIKYLKVLCCEIQQIKADSKKGLQYTVLKIVFFFPPTELFFVAGLNLTEDFRYVIQHPCQTMRTMTLNAYKFLLDWVKRQHPGPRKTGLNIICADFVGDSDFVRIVILLNKEIRS